MIKQESGNYQWIPEKEIPGYETQMLGLIHGTWIMNKQSPSAKVSLS